MVGSYREIRFIVMRAGAPVHDCKKTSPCVGIAFNDQHVARSMTHLENGIWDSMRKAGDALYDVRFSVL